LENLLKKITENKDIKIVSFDVFDTAIKRSVHQPKDVFNFVAKKFEKEFENLGIDFYKERILCEQEARCLYRSDTGKEDVSLYDIYLHFANKHKLGMDFIVQVQQYEIETELRLCKANTDVLWIYSQLKNLGYKIIFISDMYIGEDVIFKLLNRCGYSGIYLSEIYCSGDIGDCKYNGKLFEYVLSQENIKAKNLFHIGDNYNSDILQSKRLGIKSNLVVNDYGKSLFNYDIKEKEILSIYDKNDISKSLLTNMLIANELDCIRNHYYKIGYHLGIVFYNFIQWIDDQRKDGQNIFFNSRDGFILNKIYTEIFKKESTYIYTSRRSLFLASMNLDKPIDSPENMYIYNCLRFCRYKYLYELVEFIGIDTNEISEDLLTKSGFESLNDNIDQYKNDWTQTLFKINNFIKLLEPQLKEIALIKKEQFRGYWNSVNPNVKNNDIIVDIGWSGSIQHSIERMTNIKLTGMFLDLFKNAKSYEQNQHGYISDFESVMQPYTGIMEIFFSAQEGSVISYDNKTSIPILSDDMRNDIRKDILKNIHQGIYDFCLQWNNFKKEFSDLNIDVDKETTLKVLFRFLKRPTINEVKLLDLSFENGTCNNIEHITCYDENDIKKGYIKENYYRSYWKEGYLKLLRNSDYACFEGLLNPTTVDNFVNNINIAKNIKILEKTDKKFMLYGAGLVCKKIIDSSKILENKNFLGFIDKNENLNILYGKPIIRLESLKDTNIDEIYITCIQQDYTHLEILSNKNVSQEIKDKIRKIV
jgi:predicted HAD superfamily hydrolase